METEIKQNERTKNFKVYVEGKETYEFKRFSNAIKFKGLMENE